MRERKLFKEVRKYTNSKGVHVTEYEPIEELYVDSIDPFTGQVVRARILNASKHENITMYKITDTKGRFEPFYVSEDHSLIAYDSLTDNIVLATPQMLIDEPDRYFLIQQG